eukprot:SAG11_NODE_10666_length_813_cov_1.302521_2_plen_70_part_00
MGAAAARAVDFEVGGALAGPRCDPAKAKMAGARKGMLAAGGCTLNLAAWGRLADAVMEEALARCRFDTP